MIPQRLRLFVAGLVAFLVGMPLTEKAFGYAYDITVSAIDLGLSLADASGGDS